MKHGFKNFGFIILALLLSSGIMYSQTIFWEPASPVLSTDLRKDFKHVEALAVANNGDVWAGTVEGIYLSTDNGSTWVQKNNGLPIVDFYSGASTYKLIDGRISSLAINPVNGSIFFGQWNGNVYRSTDNGDTWIPVIDVVLNLPVPGTLIVPDGPKTTLFSPSGVIKAGDFLVDEATSIVFTPSGEIYVAIVNGGIFYSSDNGDTWICKSISNTIVPAWLALGPDGTLYGSRRFHSKEYGGLFRSTDGGANWVKISDYEMLHTSNLVFSADGSMFMATGDAMIFMVPQINGVLLKSTDKGITWDKVNIKISGNTYYGSVDKVVYNPITDHLLVFDGTTNEINISTDLGASWYKAQSGFPFKQRNLRSNWPRAFTINPKTGIIFVGLSYADSKYSVYRSTSAMVEPINIIGDGSTQLLENYPNPFNPTTVISYQLRQASPVTLKVFDIMGREVVTLVNGFQGQGIYNVTFNAYQYGIASGIYFYKLNADGIQLINKMLLMK